MPSCRWDMGISPSRRGSVGYMSRSGGGLGMCIGQLGLGVVRVSSVSNVAAHASRFVRNGASGAKILRTVAGMDEWQYAAVGGEWTRVPGSTHGEAMIAGTRTPSRVKLNGGSVLTRPSGLGTSTGGDTWSKKPPCSSYVTSSSVLFQA